MRYAERDPQELGTTQGDKMFHAGSSNCFRLNPGKHSTRAADADDDETGDEETSSDEDDGGDEDDDESGDGGDESDSGTVGRQCADPMHKDGKDNFNADATRLCENSQNQLNWAESYLLKISLGEQRSQKVFQIHHGFVFARPRTGREGDQDTFSASRISDM